MYINSPGGSVTDGMAIYDTMNYIKPDVQTVCVGQAASMGAFYYLQVLKEKICFRKFKNNDTSATYIWWIKRSSN